jgi:hypothetical protein
VKNQDEDLELLPIEQDPGFCEHDTYVGGCGIDWMCQWCEDGISQAERLEIEAQNRLWDIRAKSWRQQMYLALALRNGISGMEAQRIAAQFQ